ncbi:ABC transporter ATP-binding protein [Thioalkalivibrio paradoxus]|uniref:Toluene ABC transporter ATP-binding protein n=1 Tax=Thioalkalivibrio paradoxus ARh 1 TaxID=713585 RepID=W0DL42_9GAMM|nr:ATP-binding cassette domain-containing protein [Thioalkalivibrio paradoxus]AHE99304.1 toluene ABC transporter ATP-binding protein [Thioalkalivibrio paradoxus ARh 1]
MPQQSAADTPHVIIEDLVFRHGRKTVFDGLSLTVPRGRVTTVMGPSGTGKTTLLRLIGGQLRPDSGRIWVDGEEVARLSTRRLYALRKRIGMLFQTGALLSDLNVFENVAFPLREHTNLPEELIRTLVLMKLEAVGLRAARDLSPSQLSGGMARRVALARAIALDPEMIMYDEPFAGLDPITMGQIVTLVQRTSRSLGLTSVLVTHDVTEAMAISDHVVLIAEGRVMDSGTVAEVRERASDWTGQFLEGRPDGPVPFHYPGMDYRGDLLRTPEREHD